MPGKTQIVLGASFVLNAMCGCSGGDTAAGSSITQTKGGSGGSGGEAGSLSLGVDSGGGGVGGGGAASAGAGVAGATGGAMSQGGAAGGSGGSRSGGSSSGGGNSAGSGSKPPGTCKRASGNDTDCADFDSTASQAYACDDPSAYVMLNGMHDNACSSVNFVTGSKYGACCPP